MTITIYFHIFFIWNIYVSLILLNKKTHENIFYLLLLTFILLNKPLESIERQRQLYCRWANLAVQARPDPTVAKSNHDMTALPDLPFFLNFKSEVLNSFFSQFFKLVQLWQFTKFHTFSRGEKLRSFSMRSTCVRIMRRQQYRFSPSASSASPSRYSALN